MQNSHFFSLIILGIIDWLGDLLRNTNLDIFKPKIYIADFGDFKQGLWALRAKTYFRVEGVFFQQLYCITPYPL